MEELNNEVVEPVETEEAGAQAEGEEVQQQEVEEPKEQEKTFTQKEVDEIVQKRLAREKRNEEEAKKLAKMNADEKANYQLKQKEEELAEREAELAQRELTAEAKSILSEKGLDPSLSAVLSYTDAESCKASIDLLEQAINKAAQLKAEQQLKGGAPIPRAKSEDVSDPFLQKLRKYK